MKEENGSVVVDDVGAPNQKDNSKGDKLLLSILSILMVAIIGLAVGLVAVINRKVEVADSPTGSEEHSSQEGGESGEAVDEFENVREEIDEIEEKIGELSNPSTEEVVAIYQEYVDKSEDTSKKVNLLQQRIIELQKDNLGRDHSEQVIADAIAIDNLVKDTNSAVQVMNVATLYGDMKVFDEYQAILNKREANAGIDASTTETQG